MESVFFLIRTHRPEFSVTCLLFLRSRTDFRVPPLGNLRVHGVLGAALRSVNVSEAARLLVSHGLTLLLHKVLSGPGHRQQATLENRRTALCVFLREATTLHAQYIVRRINFAAYYRCGS